MKNKKTEVMKILSKVNENKMEEHSILRTLSKTFNLKNKSLQVILSKNFPKIFKLKTIMRIKKSFSQEEG